jgi:hypothetical protein
MVEATFFSETSILTSATRRHIPEDGILHSHRREYLISYQNRYIAKPMCYGSIMTEAEFEQATPVYTYLIAHPLDQDLTF